jgi:GT2 family glycosyltransferase
MSSRSLPEHPSVSVIIVNWNQKLLLMSCLRSIGKQSYGDHEVLVVDNGSTDGSPNMVRREFPQVRLIALGDNLGFCAANNLALKHARGSYVALLNNDAEVSSDWLRELVGAIDRHPEVGFCASKILLWEHPELADACGDYYTVEGIADKIGHERPADPFDEECEVFGASAAAAIYRRSMLEEVGFFDEDFFMTHEDSDISFRAQLMGYRCLFVPTAIVHHHLSTSVGASSDFHYWQSRRNIEFVFVKNMPAKWLVRYLPLHLFANTILFLLDMWHGRTMLHMGAKGAALKMLPRMLKKRKKIQANRRVSDEYVNAIFTHGWLRDKVRMRLKTWR